MIISKNRKTINAIILQTLTLVLFAYTANSQSIEINVNAANVKNNISNLIYGSNIEDVNHEIYGGFYNQKVFGESFEEPATNVDYNGWRKYNGFWLAENDYVSIVPGRHTTRDVFMNKIFKISVEPDRGAKLIYEPLTLANGTIEVEMKFLATAGQGGGVIFHVSSPGIGDNIFNGYEVSLNKTRKKAILSKYANNVTLLKETDVSFTPEEWTKLKIVLNNKSISVYVNGTNVLEYEDENLPLSNGKVGLKTSRSAVSFKNVAINNTKIALSNNPAEQISYNWDILSSKNINAQWMLDSTTAYNGKNSQVIDFISGKGRAGIVNKGLNRWGIAVNKGKKLEGRLYIKSLDFKGAVSVALENADGTKTYAVKTIKGITNSWEKYNFSLTPNGNDPNARLAIYIQDKGKIWVDQVVLSDAAKDLYKGVPVRADIANALVDQGLTFVRYAGTMVNASGYKFKSMIGDPDKRPPYTGHWNEYSSNGFGIEEFLKFAEAAGIEPVFTINIYETPEDAADMIEYLKGSVSSKWGGIRAKNGHPQPYHVKYIEIGNEEVIFNGDNADDYKHYIERFDLLYQAMHAKDPSIKFIHSAWWRPESPNMELVFKALNGKAAYWDLHVDGDDPNSGTKTEKQLDLMAKLFMKLDPQTTMKVAVFEENGSKHGIQRALGHATNMNAVRRFGDFVLTSTPANGLQPYLQNDNSWDQGQVFFTPDKVWGMPPYYSQQMQASNHLPLRVEDITVGKLDVTATKSEDSKSLVIHIVNTENSVKEAKINLKDFEGRKPEVQVFSISGELTAVNTPENPDQYKTIKKTVSMPGATIQYSFPAYSYTILRFEK